METAKIYRLNRELPAASPAAPMANPTSSPQKPKLLNQVRQAIRIRHYSPRTEETYVGWIKRFIFFHDTRHPIQMGEPEIARFLSSLATESHVSASTQNQAFNALLFLYQEVLQRKIGIIQGVVRAKNNRRLPVVLTKEEVKRVLDCMRGTPWLMVMLLYGAGLRLMECCRLRVKDIDFSRSQIVVRAGKGDKDRHTMLPATVKEPLLRHLQAVKQQHEADLRAGLGRVNLPTPWSENIRMQGKSGVGSGYSLQQAISTIESRAKNADTISTSLCSRRRSKRQG